jgi:protein-tyrosine phosphatase
MYHGGGARMPTRTSEADPIRVDFLPEGALRTPGRIGMTFAPGKIDRSSVPRWSRDLGADLARLAGEYGANVLVSLVEDLELERLGIPSLVRDASLAGIETIRFPMVDGRAPRSVPATRAVVTNLMERAERGDHIVIHCRAGLGRTGLLAACCLIARGHAPDAAVTIVRAARAGTVETAEQMEFVRSFAQ